MLGTGFDTDPQLAWAPEILHDSTLVDPISRMDDLWDQAMVYMEQVLGPDGVFPNWAYQRERRQRRAIPHAIAGATEDTLLSYFYDIWPEKAEYVGTDTLHTMIGETKKAAESYGINHEREQAEFSIHAFLFGHLFFTDLAQFQIRVLQPARNHAE